MALAHRMKSSGGRTFGDNLHYCTITQTPSQQNCNEVHVVTIGANFRDGGKAVSISTVTWLFRYSWSSIKPWRADTWLLLQAKWALENAARIVIQSPDTDVLVISTSHFHSLLYEELCFQTGIKDQLWFVPVHIKSVWRTGRANVQCTIVVSCPHRMWLNQFIGEDWKKDRLGCT